MSDPSERNENDKSDPKNTNDDKNKDSEEEVTNGEKHPEKLLNPEAGETPKILTDDPLEKKQEEEQEIKKTLGGLKEGDMVKTADVILDAKDTHQKMETHNLIQDMIAEEEVQPERNNEGKIGRKNSKRVLLKKTPFSWGNLDTYLHEKYESVNVLLRCFIECFVIIFIFMFFPILLILLPPYTKSYNIFKNTDPSLKVNNYTEFFRENLFVSLCYCIFIFFSLITDRMLIVVGYILTMLGVSVEGFVAEILQMLVASKKHLRNAIVSILVFYLAVLLISNYKFLSTQISLCHFFMTLIFWFFCMSTILFIETFCMNILLSELRRKSFRGRIWDVNYKTFVFKKLAAIADASISGSNTNNEKVRMLIWGLKNDFDTGFFLRHNDLNLTSQDQAKAIPNDIFVFLHLNDDVMPYDLIKRFFPANHLEVYGYLSGNTVTKETTDFPPIPYETFESKCVELFQERMDIARSLYDRDNILRKLDFILFSVVLFFGIIIFLFLLNVDYKVYVASIGPTVFGLGWIFQDSIKELYRCFVFLLLSHPFDCGDRVRIDNEELIALRIDLLYTTFVTLTGKIKYIPNAAMFLKTIENYRRSDLQSEEVTMTVSKATTFDQLLSVRDKLSEFLRLNQNNFTGTIYIRNYEPAGDSMKVVFSIEHSSNFQDIKPRFIRRDIFLKELERVLDSEGISYNHAFTISD